MKKVLKHAIAVLTAIIAAATAAGSVTTFAEVTPNPVISRNCPVYSSGAAQATAANDEHYFSFWSGTSPDYIAYDLSDVPDSQKKRVIAVWYNTSTFEKIGDYASSNMLPTDYTIEINKAEGGSFPEDGWETVETVKGNTFSSRQHLIDMEGCNWIRINISKADNETGKQASVNFDIHNVSDGVSDSWLFLGDSITAGGMNNCYGTGFATHVNTIDSRYFPIQENGGIGGIKSIDGKNNIDRWLSVSHAKYVSVAYGTNDAWGNPNAADAYYENTKYMIDAILNAGKIPVLPKIPSSSNSDVKPNVPIYNAKVERLYEEYGDKLIKGPDFEAFFNEHPEYLSSDGVHPESEGYEAMRKLWAETMYTEVYTAENAPTEPEISTEDSTKPSDTPEINFIPGDVYSDNIVNVLDASALREMLMHDLPAVIAPSPADTNGNGNIETADLVLLHKYLVGKESELKAYRPEN